MVSGNFEFCFLYNIDQMRIVYFARDPDTHLVKIGSGESLRQELTTFKKPVNECWYLTGVERTKEARADLKRGLSFIYKSLWFCRVKDTEYFNIEKIETTLTDLIEELTAEGIHLKIGNRI